MTRWRAFAALGAAVVLSLGLIGTAFSLFKDPDAVEVSGDSEYNNAVDDIEENWILSDNNQQDNYYDIYFFVQQQAAKASGDPLINYTPQVSTDSGYWKSDVLAPGVEQQATYGTCGWRKITVYRSISAEQLDSVGVGKTTRDDQEGWTYNFSGWTADKATAAEMIDKQQGEYNYFSSLDNLAELDESTDDGSEAGDHKIYLYPIYTLGKDPAGGTSANAQPVVQLQDKEKDSGTGEDNRFFSQTGSGIDSLFYYNNFTVTQEDIDNEQFHLQVSAMRGTYAGHSYWTWHGRWAWAEDTTKLFPSAGTYNIYVKLCIRLKEWDPSWEWDLGMSDADWCAHYTEEMKNEWVDSLDEVSVNSLRLTHNREYTGATNDAQAMVAFISVSRVFEPRYLGGSEGTFDYTSDRPRFFEYEGWFGNTSYDTNTSSDQILRTYAIQNFYLDPSRTFTYQHTEEDGSNSGTFKYSVFSLDVSELDHNTNSFWHNNQIQAMSDDDLSAITSSSDSWFQSTWYTIDSEGDNIGLRHAEAQESAGDTDYDYSVVKPSGQYTESHRDLLAVDEAGYYDIAVAITYYKDISDKDMDNTNPVNFISGIKVAIRRSQNSYWVRIYENNTFSYHTSDTLTESGSQTFVTWDLDNNPSTDNSQQYIYTSDGDGETTIDYNDKVFSDGSSSYSLNDIIQSNEDHLYEHVTGRDLASAVNKTFTIDKNYILYLSNS